MTSRTKKLAVVGGMAIAIGALTAPSWGTPSAAGAQGIGSRAPAIQVELPGGSLDGQVAFRPGSGQLVVDWNKELLKIEQTPGAQPSTVHPTRSFALLHAAIYDAVVSTTHVGNPYAFSVVAPRQARPDAAADQAAHDTLVSLFPSFAPELNQMLGGELAAIPDGAAKAAGVTVGERTATLILALRANDGSANAATPFVPGSQPGNYQITPPNFPQPVFTNWGGITPWVLTAGDQFRPPPPPPLSSPRWAAAINEVQSLGQNSSTTRTADETTIAEFWAPPIWNTWNEIADGQIIAHKSNLEDASRLSADLNFALADSAIAFYDAKYHYQLWRPVTAIRAGTPNNPAADPANPSWLPQATNTAADPSYPAAHSTISEAAATVLAAFYGDRVQLNVESDALPGVVRSFDSFQAAADEATLSRIFAGQHTRIDVSAGTTLGRQVANAVLDQSAP
jgi:PAP2 superfamily